jgi:hypothetical protein
MNIVHMMSRKGYDEARNVMQAPFVGGRRDYLAATEAAASSGSGDPCEDAAA